MTFKITLRAMAIAAVALGTAAHADPVVADAGHGKPAIGAPGNASAADRTIEIVLRDNYFEPEAIAVAADETIRFVVRNDGAFVHEFNIGTAAMHEAHQAEMMMMLDHGVLQADHIDWEAAKAMQASMGHGMHDDPNSVLLEPGKSAEIVWTFPQEGALQFACNVPGHYAAGMQGEFELLR